MNTANVEQFPMLSLMFHEFIGYLVSKPPVKLTLPSLHSIGFSTCDAKKHLNLFIFHQSPMSPTYWIYNNIYTYIYIYISNLEEIPGIYLYSRYTNQHLPVRVPSSNPKGWWIDTLLRNHLAPKLEGPGIDIPSQMLNVWYIYQHLGIV